ncbi:MAG: hypothetical protein VX589_04560 [Myxococcota bacterium]|nr:hypothetical protein [Myxococcota bacterium]
MKKYCLVWACAVVVWGQPVVGADAMADALLGANPAWKKLAVGHRPVMVILMDYDDVRFARTTRQTKRHFQDWFFSKSKFPSLYQFFKENSFGRLRLHPAGEIMVVRAVDEKKTPADESSFQCMDAWRPVSGGQHLPIPHYKQWIVEPVCRGSAVRLRAASNQNLVLNIQAKHTAGSSPRLGGVSAGSTSAHWRKVSTTKGHFKLQSAWKKTLFLGADGDRVVLSKTGIEWTQVALPSGRAGLMRTDTGYQRPFKFMGVSLDRKQTITSHGHRGCGGIEVRPGGGGQVENLVRLYQAIRLAQTPRPPKGESDYSSKSAQLRRFDKNNDGKITDDELIMFIIAPNAHRPTTGGAVRRVHVTGLKDSKGTFQVSMRVGAFSDLIDFLTFGHEAAHLFGALDLYGPGGQLNHTMSLMGAQAHKAPAGPHTLHVDPYHKIRFGWVKPRIVTSGTFDCATLKAPNTGGKPAKATQRPLVIRDPDASLAKAGAFLFEYRVGHGKKNYDGAFFADGQCIEGKKYGACRVWRFKKKLKDNCMEGAPPCPYWIDTRYAGVFRRAKKTARGYTCTEGTRSGQSNCKVASLPQLKGKCYPGGRACLYWIDTQRNGVFTVGRAISKTRDGVVSWWVGAEANACHQGGCKHDGIATSIKAGSSGQLRTAQPAGDDRLKSGRIEPGPNKMLETKKHPQDEYEFQQYDVSTVGQRNGTLSFGAKAVWTYDDGLVRLPVRMPVDGGRVAKLALSNWWFRVGKRQKGGQIDIAWGIDKGKLTQWSGRCPRVTTTLIGQAKKTKRQARRPKRNSGQSRTNAKAKRQIKRPVLSKEIRKDCGKALKSVCRGSKSTVKSALKCLRKHRRQVSRACRQRVAPQSGKARRKSTPTTRRRSQLETACRRDLMRVCTRVQPAQRLSCLKRHEKKLTPACRRHVRLSRRASAAGR